MDQDVIEKTFLLKDVKPISRNDGNLIQIVLQAPFSADLLSELGQLFDTEVNVAIEPCQQELIIETAEDDSQLDLTEAAAE